MIVHGQVTLNQVTIEDVPRLPRCIPATPSQAFVDEVVNIGELRWLEEWKDSKDKLGLLAKVVCISVSLCTFFLQHISLVSRAGMFRAPREPGARV